MSSPVAADTSRTAPAAASGSAPAPAPAAATGPPAARAPAAVPGLAAATAPAAAAGPPGATAPGAPSSRPGGAPLPPGPDPRSTARWLRLLSEQEGPLDFLDRMGHRFGDVAMLRARLQNLVVVRGPEAVRHVLLASQDNYRKSNQYELLAPVLGNGLVTSSGELWQRQRKLVQPMFAKRHLGVFADHMAQAAGSALDAWERQWPDGHPLELAEEILHIGLDTVGRALVGHDFTDRASEFGAALGNALHQVGAIGRATSVTATQYLPHMTIMRAAILTQHRRYRSAMSSAEVLQRVSAEIVDERLRGGHGDRGDLLRLLMEATDEETGERMSRRQVLDELLTFTAAGHETTAHGLAWMYYLLSQHPAARERMEAEVDEVLAGRVPTGEDAERLPWTRACFEEAMRLYPPVWHVQRVAIDDDVIGGYRIPAGTLVFVSIWSTHRDPAIWENPAGFDPRRFLGDTPKQRPRFAYLPFGGGRRICVGHGFAMMNATILAAMIAQRFRFNLIPGAPIVLDPTVTIRPLHGIPVTIHRRRGAPPRVAGSQVSGDERARGQITRYLAGS